MRRYSTLLTVTALMVALTPAVQVAHISDAVADTTFTADFEAYSAGTEITNQYPFVTFDSFHVAGDGFTFGVNPSDGVVVLASGNPLVAASGAHDGTNSGLIYCGTEFCGTGVFGLLNYTADEMSVYVGDQGGTGEQLELDAYDANRDYLGDSTLTTTSAGASELMSFTAPAGKDIAYFDVYQRGPFDAVPLDIDDFSVSVPAGSVPTVGVSASAGSYEVGKDGTIQIPLTIHRINGATGDVDIDVEGFTAHVTGSATDPGTGNSSTLTVSADHTAPLTDVPLTISASATDTNSQPSNTVHIDVITPISFAAPTGITSQTCESNTFTVEAQVAPGEPGSTVAFSTSFLPVTTGLTASATTPITISSGLADTSVHVSSTGGGVNTTLKVTALLINGDSATVNISVTREAPDITAVDAIDAGGHGPVAGKLAMTPRSQGPGTTIEVYGHGFCDTATVFVGNDHAGVSATVQHKSSGQGPYDYIRIETPRLATSGSVTVEAGSPSVTSAASGTALVVDSYRNTNGWQFHNFDPNLIFDDLVQAYGTDQTYIHIDPCGFFTLGFGHCSVDVVPDPTAYIFLGIAQASMESGTCFGFSLSTQRLLEGIDSLPGNLPSIFDQPAPDTDHDAQANHGVQPVLDLLKADHLMQLSDEFLTQWGPTAQALQISDPSTVTPALAGEIEKVLSAGRFPLIEMNDNGEGHVVIAYDIVQTGTGTFDVYVYDSNDQFQPSENTDGSGHASAVNNAVIHLTTNGQWSLASTPEKDGTTPFHGGPGGLVVTDPQIIPKVPHLGSFSGAAVPGSLFSSNSAPGSASRSSAAAITQVSSGGRTLYGSGGGLNTNPSTRLAAMPMPAFVSGSTASVGQLIDVGKHVRSLKVSTTGSKTGGATLTYVQGAYAGEVQTSTSSGAKQGGSFNSKAGTVGYTGTTTNPVTLDVARTATNDEHDVSVTVAKPGSADALTLGAGKGAVTLSHTGAATTFTITLSGNTKGGLPQTFTGKPIALGANQSAHVDSISWGHSGGTVKVKVGTKTITLHNLTAKPHGAKITTLHVSKKGKKAIDAVLKMKLPKLPAGSQAIAVWFVHNGHKLLTTHRVVLSTGKRSVTSRWLIKLAKHKKWRHKRLTFTAVVVTIAVHGGAEKAASSHRSTHYRVP